MGEDGLRNYVALVLAELGIDQALIKDKLLLQGAHFVSHVLRYDFALDVVRLRIPVELVGHAVNDVVDVLQNTVERLVLCLRLYSLQRVDRRATALTNLGFLFEIAQFWLLKVGDQALELVDQCVHVGVITLG